jgi:hypothetical protein
LRYSILGFIGHLRVGWGTGSRGAVARTTFAP